MIIKLKKQTITRVSNKTFGYRAYRNQDAIVVSVEDTVVVDVPVAGVSLPIFVHVCLIAVRNIGTIVLIVLRHDDCMKKEKVAYMMMDLKLGQIACVKT